MVPASRQADSVSVASIAEGSIMPLLEDVCLSGIVVMASWIGVFRSFASNTMSTGTLAIDSGDGVRRPSINNADVRLIPPTINLFFFNVPAVAVSGLCVVSMTRTTSESTLNERGDAWRSRAVSSQNAIRTASRSANNGSQARYKKIN